MGFCPHCTDLALLGCSSCIMAYYCQNTLRIQIMQVEQPWKLFLGTRGLWPTIWCLLNSTGLSFVILYLGPILPRRAMFSNCSRCVLYFKNTEKRQGHNELKVTVNLSDLIAPSTFFWTSSMWNLCPLRLNLSLKTWQWHLGVGLVIMLCDLAFLWRPIQMSKQMNKQEALWV